MKFKRIVLFLIAIALVFLAFKILLIPDKPPMPKVTYQNEPIKILQGSYGWQTLFTGVESDSPIPPELVGKIPPTNVAPQSNIKVTFDYKPNNVEVFLWSNAVPQKYSIDHNRVIMPKNKGTYVFEIRAEWIQGDSIYAFKIEVNE